MKTNETELEKPSFWQLVFTQSKVNGAHYIGEQLPGSKLGLAERHLSAASPAASGVHKSNSGKV